MTSKSLSNLGSDLCELKIRAVCFCLKEALVGARKFPDPRANNDGFLPAFLQKDPFYTLGYQGLRTGI